MSRRRLATLALLGASLAVMAAGYPLAAALWAGPRVDAEQSWVTWQVARWLGIDLNRYQVRVDPTLSLDAVDVWWRSEVEPTPAHLFSAGRLVAKTPAVYGYNTFTVCYAGKPLAQFGHFKRNRNHYHAYSVSIRRDGSGTIAAEVTSVGPDHLWIEAVPPPSPDGEPSNQALNLAGACAPAG
jgi:hypothetical protein